MEQPIIQIDHLGKEFQTSEGKVRALNDINLEICQGEIFGIIGLSGAGKSTLVRCINYLEVPTEGDVRLPCISFFPWALTTAVHRRF